MTSEEMLDKIIRYGQFLEKALGKRQDQQVLIVLEKLDRLPISLDHLQETGIGKTVNGYRKCSDPVGKKAKAIVNKWKGLVQAAIAEDQTQKSDSSPVRTDCESEHMSHGNAMDEEIVNYDSSGKNKSHVVHTKERSTSQAKAYGMETHTSNVKRKTESGKDAKSSKKPCDDSVGLERYSGHISLKSDSQDMAHHLTEFPPCNGLDKDGKCSDVSKKDASYQSRQLSSGTCQDSTSNDLSRSSGHSSSQRVHKSNSHKSSSTSRSSRDIMHRDRSSQKDGKNSALASMSDSSHKSANIVSDVEVLPQNGTSVKSQSAEKNQGNSNISGKHAENLDLSNSLKRKTNDFGVVDLPIKKQLLESEASGTTKDLLDSPACDDRGSSHTKQSGHRDHSSPRDSSSKRNSSSHKDSSLPKGDPRGSSSRENSTSQSKSSSHDKSSMNREKSSSKELSSGKHQSHRESADKNSSQRESSSKDSSKKQSSIKLVSSGKTSSDKESSNKHSSQKQSSSLPPGFKGSSRNVSNEKLSSLESFSESFPDDTVESSSLEKFVDNSERDHHKVVEGSSRAGISQTVSKRENAAAFSALDSDDGDSSCGLNFEEVLNYDVELSKAASKAIPVSSKNASDLSKASKQDDSRIAKDESGSRSCILPDSSSSVNEKDCVLGKGSLTAESNLKKCHSSKSEGSSRENRKYDKAISGHHHKVENSNIKEQGKSSSNHNNLKSSSSKEHSKLSSSQQKLESSSSKSSSSQHHKSKCSSSKEPGKSDSSSHTSESSNKKYADYSKDKNSKPLEQRKDTKEPGHKSGKSSSEKVRSVAVDSDANSEDFDDNNGISFEDFLNYDASVSQKKFSSKNNRPNVTGSKDKVESKLRSSKNDWVDGLSLSHPLVSMPLPKQEELNLGLDSDGLPLYPSMRQELQVKKDNVEKLVNLERRYGQKMIYSGKKQAAVPIAMTSLFAACMQVLQENIDDITFVGGIPAEILSPVLELCSVSQLEKLEYYNPQFVGDTEDLWKIHCNRDFRGHDPDELESWRELYLRLQDARNKRLALISQSVMANKKRAEKEVPRIQLTYVDHSLCTGRRTSKKLAAVRTAALSTVPDETSQPRSKQEILDSLKDQVSKPMARRRGGNRPEIKSVSKPSAPLMQKTLKFLKGMKR